MIMGAIKPNDRKFLVNLDPRCMVVRIYGTISCVPWFQRSFFLVFPHFKSIEAYDSMASIDTRSMDGRIYVGDHKTLIYKLCVSPFQRRFF